MTTRPVAAQLASKAKAQASAPTSTPTNAANGARVRQARGAAAATARGYAAGDRPPVARICPSTISATAPKAARATSQGRSPRIDIRPTLLRRWRRVVGRGDGWRLLLKEYAEARQ